MGHRRRQKSFNRKGWVRKKGLITDTEVLAGEPYDRVLGRGRKRGRETAEEQTTGGGRYIFSQVIKK